MSYQVKLTFLDHNKEIKKLIHPLQQELARTYEIISQIDSYNSKGRDLAIKYVEIMSSRSAPILERLASSSSAVQNLPSMTKLMELDAVQTTLRLKLKNIWEEPVVSGKVEEAEKESDQAKKVEPLIFACESISIRAGDDLRIQIPYSLFPSLDETKIYHFKWSFELKNVAGSIVKNSNSDSTDIGFAISELQGDGSLPQLIAYKRYNRKQKSSGEALVLMNEEERVSLGANRAMPILYRGDGNCLVVIFDNSYSFFRGKELRYHVSVEPYVAPPPPLVPDLSADEDSQEIAGLSIDNEYEINAYESSSDDTRIEIPNHQQSLQLIGLCEELTHFLGTNDVLSMMS